MTVLFFKRFIFKLFESTPCNTCNSVAIYVSDLKCCMFIWFICMGKVVPACQISAGSNAKHANNKALNCVHGYRPLYDPPDIFLPREFLSCMYPVWRRMQDTDLRHLLKWDTDLQKSSDFLLNPICM